MPSTYNIDIEFLAKLYRESDLAKIKWNHIKKQKWQLIAVNYCNVKNIPLIDYKILSRKWSKSVTSAQKIRSKGIKSSKATGGGPQPQPMSEIVLAAAEANAEANADLTSDFNCEPGDAIDQGELTSIS